MSRQFKPKPNNPLTERFRGELTNTDIKRFIEHERLIGDNIIIVDDFIGKGFCEEYMNEALHVEKESRWLPNIQYGDAKPWPLAEWGYTLIDSPGDKWYDNKMTEKSQKLWEQFKDYMKDSFDVDIFLNGGHINATTFGQESMIHQDHPDGTDAFVIIFFNDDMNSYDGGELQTYINMNPNFEDNLDFHQSETNYSINPKAGRIVIADSRILHRGLAPTRFYAKTRMTVVFKFTFDKDKKMESFKKMEFKW